MKNSGSSKNTAESRRQYVEAFTGTMIDIWHDRLALLKVIDTGALYSSLASGLKIADEQVSVVSMSFDFKPYGKFVERGTGRETPHGNSGDIGRVKVRTPKRWYFRKYLASVYNIRDFMLGSFNTDFVKIIDNTLSGDIGQDNMP